MYMYLLLYIAWIIYNREILWYLNLNLVNTVTVNKDNVKVALLQKTLFFPHENSSWNSRLFWGLRICWLLIIWMILFLQIPGPEK